jgi:ribonuclease HI
VVVFGRDMLVDEWSLPAGWLCSSYAAELTAMESATQWLSTREWNRAVIITDSQSLVEALRAGGSTGARMNNMERRMREMRDGGRELEVLWVPGHCGLDGNERADEMARRGAEKQQTIAALDEGTRKAYIRRAVERDRGEVSHERTRQTYRTGVREDREKDLTKQETVDLARFRAGHHTKLRSWGRMIGRDGEATCCLCGEEEENSEHLWVRCPALARDRMEHRMGGGLWEMVDSPVQVIALLRIILSRL